MKIVVMDKIHRDEKRLSHRPSQVTKKLVIIGDDSEPKILRSSKHNWWNQNTDIGKGW